MARRWLLGVLASTALTIGFGATAASAQELPLTSSSDPVTVSVPEAGSVTVTAEPTEATLEVLAEPDVEVEEVDTDLAPTVAASLSPEGPSLDLSGPTEVAGEPLPVDDVIEPVEEVVGGAEEALPTEAAAPAPAPATPTTTRASGDGAVTPAGEPEPQVAPRAPLPASARRAFAVGGRPEALPAVEVTEGELAPQVAPPAADEPIQLAMPVVDPTPTVPAGLRLLAGLMVLGAAATWRKVQQQLA